MENIKKGLIGPKLNDFTIGSWCPNQDGVGPPTAVSITLGIANVGDVVLRLKSPNAVDNMIELLQKYKQEVWPQPLKDGQHRHKGMK